MKLKAVLKKLPVNFQSKLLSYSPLLCLCGGQIDFVINLNRSARPSGRFFDVITVALGRVNGQKLSQFFVTLIQSSI